MEYLNNKIQEYSKRKYFLYNCGCKNNPDKYHCQCACFNFFEEYDLYVKNYINNIDIMHIKKLYTPEQRFNYYLLIKENFYKFFKKMECNIKIGTMIHNAMFYRNRLFCLFPDVTKFDKNNYNKKYITIDSIRYVKLKLRAFSNTFITDFCITAGPDEKTPEIRKYFRDTQLEFLCTGNIINDKLKIMAIPVKKKYTNLFRLNDCISLNGLPDSIKFDDNFTLYYDHNWVPTGIIEKIIDLYKEKKYFDNLGSINDGDFVVLVNNKNDKKIGLNIFTFY